MKILLNFWESPHPIFIKLLLTLGLIGQKVFFGRLLEKKFSFAGNLHPLFCGTVAFEFHKGYLSGVKTINIVLPCFFGGSSTWATSFRASIK